jgi:hypothetical protein
LISVKDGKRYLGAMALFTLVLEVFDNFHNTNNERHKGERKSWGSDSCYRV